MPISTIATRLLGIEHPIICGGMTATGSAELAAAVSNAGGLGMLTALHAKTPERLDDLIKQCRSLTDKPFGVNLTILGEKRGAPEFPHEFAKVITSNNIKIMETCGGGIPLMQELHKILRAGGVEVIISKCVQVKHAIKAQDELGADMVSLMGYDSGGLPGEADIGIFIQMALAQRQLKIPFIASGGVATGRQLLAALASGAAAVQIGTRFNATQECNIFPRTFKQRMVEAGDRDTIIVMKPMRASSRVLKNKTAEAMVDIEKAKGVAIKFQDIAHLGKFDLLMEGLAQEDPDMGVWNCGQSVALIDDVPSCLELVTRIIAEAEEAHGALGALFVSKSRSRL